MKKVLLIFIVIGALVSGCDKYEQTLKKIYGQYTLKTYSVNGIDSLSLYQDSLGTSFRFYYDEVSNENICSISGIRNDGDGTLVTWNWKLNYSNKILSQIFSAGFSIGIGPFGVGKNNIEWKIINLTKKEIKMSTNYNDKEYMVILNKI